MRNLKHHTPSSKHNKMVRISNGPHWALLCRVPSGDQIFSGFQKRPPESWDFESGKYPSQTTIKWKELKRTPLGSTFQRPYGDKTFSRFQKGEFLSVN